VDAPAFAAVLSQARGGSIDAMGQLFELCRGYLLLIAQQEYDIGLQAKTSPSDLVQDTFYEAHRDFATFQGSSEAEFLAWMRRLLLNNIANFSRSYRQTDKRAISRELSLEMERARYGFDSPAADDTPSRRAMAREQALSIDQAMDSLPEDYRRVITLRNREERDWEEIASLMRLSANAARKLWLRAVEQLRKKMGRNLS